MGLRGFGVRSRKQVEQIGGILLEGMVDRLGSQSLRIESGESMAAA